MAKTKKYAGIVRENLAYPGNCYHFNDIGNPTGQLATLVLHECAHERVFTESEVNALVNDLFRAQADPAAFTERKHVGGTYGFEEPVSEWAARAKAVVRKAHGISNPA